MSTQTTQFQNVVALHQAMVRIDTVNSNVSGRTAPEAALCNLLEAFAKAQGFTTRRLPMPDGAGDQLLITYQVDASLPWLMFESHMDTVSVEGMTIPPFDATIKDGKVWGRGSSDTKNTGACMLWAMLRYKALPRSSQHFNAALVFTVDEEIGMTGVRSLCQDHLANLGFKPVGAIVGEPTSHRPFSAHNGAIRWQITTYGVACHSADPSKGRSAITDMVKVIQAIESKYIPTLKQTHPMTGKAQCSINLIRGGTQVNIIPASCEIRIDRRLIPGEDETAVIGELRPLLDELEQSNPGMKAQDVMLKFSPPLSDKNNARLLAHVGRAISKLGHNPAPLGAAFATDAGDLDHAGIPCIVIGPGDIAQAHTKDEFIEISQLEQGVEAYLSLLTTAWE